MARKGGKKILIVEDEKAYSRALVLKLQNAGFEAESVEDGEQALEAIRKNHFDLMMLDLVMPKLNGFGVLEKMRAENLKVPVFVLSNLSQVEDQMKALQFGVSIFFQKSDTPISDIVNKVQSFLKD